LYLWAKSWEKEGVGSSTLQTSASQTQVAPETELKPQLENTASCTHDGAESKEMEQKDVLPVIDHSENGGVENLDTVKPDPVTEDSAVNIEQHVQEEIVVETETSEIVSSVHEVKDENRLEGNTLEESNETEIETITAENTDGNKIVFSTSMGSSLSSEQNSSSISDQNNSDTTALLPNENVRTETGEIHLQIEAVAGKVNSLQAAKNVHERTQEAHPAVEQVQEKEETSDAVIENMEVQSEKKENCVDEVCPDTKLTVIDASRDDSKQPYPSSDEGAVKSSSEEKPDETTPQPDSHGLLHQALTNGSQVANPLNNGGIGSQYDTSGHPMLQLPICQSELMQFANTMADNLRVTGKFKFTHYSIFMKIDLIATDEVHRYKNVFFIYL
jgi:hypothetical protein